MGIQPRNIERKAPEPWVFNRGGIDTDFIVRGLADDNLLYCDAGNDRVGIKNAAPAATLDVTGSLAASTTITAGTGLTVTAGGLTVTAGGITVTAGVANFNAAGLRTVQAVNNVHDTVPTAAELTTSFGAVATLGRGFLGTVDDADGDTNGYIVWASDGAFYFVKGTKAT